MTVVVETGAPERDHLQRIDYRIAGQRLREGWGC